MVSVLRIALFTLAGLLVAVANPFGVQTAASNASENAFLSILSSSPRGAGENWETPIAIILITKADVEQFGFRLPLLRYSTYCTLLSAVAAHEPLAVFLDVSFKPRTVDRWSVVGRNSRRLDESERAALQQAECSPFDDADSYQQFENFLIDYDQKLKNQYRTRRRQEGKPLRLRPSTHLFVDFEPTAASAATGAKKWQSASQVPLRVFRPPNTYILQVDQKGVASSHGRRSPALALYEVLCRDGHFAADNLAHPCRPGPEHANDAARAIAKVQGRREMVLQWSRGDPFAPIRGAEFGLHRPVCENPDGGTFGTVAASVKRLLIHLLFEDGSAAVRSVLSPCPNIRYFTVSELLAGVEGERAQTFLTESIRDRAVMIGFHFNVQETDYVWSPVYGQTPGVFAHAAALEYLLRDGANVLRPASALQLFGAVSITDIVSAGIVFVTLVLAAAAVDLIMKTPDSFDRNEQGGNRGDKAAIALTSFLLIGATLGFLFLLLPLMLWASYSISFLRLSPSGWAGAYAAVVSMAVVLFSRRYLCMLTYDGNGCVKGGPVPSMLDACLARRDEPCACARRNAAAESGGDGSKTTSQPKLEREGHE